MKTLRQKSKNFLKRFTWKIYHYEEDQRDEQPTNNYGLKTNVHNLIFEDGLFKMINEI